MSDRQKPPADEADHSENEKARDGTSDPPSVEPEPISMREIEMILAPGKPPPPRAREGSHPDIPKPPPPRPREGSHPDIPKPPPLPRPRLASAPDLARPPRPPLKSHGGPASMPPDMGATDLEDFAVLGASPMPPKLIERPRPRPPLKSHGDTTVKKLVEEDSRARASAGKPSAIQAPPDSAHEDLRMLASRPPPAGKDVVDFDDILRVGNSALSGALSAPSLPADIDGLAKKEGAKIASPGAPKAPLKKKRTEPLPSDGEARESKKSSTPPSSRRKSRRPVDTGAVESRSGEETRSSIPARASVSKSTAPRPPPPEVKSRAPLYAGLAVLAGAALFFLLRSPGETPSTEKPTRSEATQTAAPAITMNPVPPSEPTQVVPPVSTTESTPEPTARVTTNTATLPAATGAIPPTTGTPPTASTTKPSVVVPTATAAPTAAGEFDRSVANAALGAAVGRASGCKQPGDPSGVAKVQVTFAPSGRVTTANVAGPPFAGTPTGGCIARAFKASTIPPFVGAPMTVSKTVSIP